MKIAVCLLLLWFSAASASQQLAQEENPTLYFASTDNEAYLDWLDNNTIYTSSVFLPSPAGAENGAAIHWSIDENHINLAVAARATGWVGFGIAESGNMKGADMVLYTAATNELVDAHVLDDINMGPIPDDCQSWTLKDFQTHGGFLIFEAVRLLDTQDPQDRPIMNDAPSFVAPSRIIAAWGDSDHVSYHGPDSRARTSVRFRNNNNALNEGLFRAAMDNEANGFIELRANNHELRAVKTRYDRFCFTFADLVEQGLPADEEVHVIGFEPIVDPVSAKYLHHLTVFGREQDGDQSGEGWCEEYLVGNIMYMWAPGETPTFLPDNVGAPFGKNAFLSFQMEIHYNNPTLDVGVVDNSGVRFYYTTKKRQHDLGVLVLGDPLVLLRKTRVGDANFPVSRNAFDCPPSCSLLALTGIGPVTVLREQLHMHQSGTRMYNRQIRNGHVIHEGYVDFFDFDQQGGYAVQQEPYVVQAGDGFQTSCYYKNNGQEIKFGASSQDEMCMAFLFYYPRVTILNQFPYACGYGLGTFCGADWVQKDLANMTEVDRVFGTPTDVCRPGSHETPSPLSNTTTPSPSPPSSSSTPEPSFGFRVNFSRKALLLASVCFGLLTYC